MFKRSPNILFSLILAITVIGNASQSQIQAQSIKQQKTGTTPTIKIKEEKGKNNGLIYMPLSPEAIERLNLQNREGEASNYQESIVEPSPRAIRSNIPNSSVSFFATSGSSDITAIADINDDQLLDVSAKETLFSLTDKNEVAISFAVGKKSGKFYLGTINKTTQMGSVTIIDNLDGSYQGTKKKSFSIGKGSPMSMSVLETSKGDALIVGQLFVEKQGINDPSPNDFFSISAYLPASDGLPDSTKVVEILRPNQDVFGATFNFSFGGMALDSKGNLYVNLADTSRAGSIGGTLSVFSDSDGDEIPDKLGSFVDQNTGTPAQITASSIVIEPNPNGGNNIFFFTCSDLIFAPSAPVVSVYFDKDGDLKADQRSESFFRLSRGFYSVLRSLGQGTSAFITSRMALSNGQGIVSYVEGSKPSAGLGINISNSGVMYFNKSTGETIPGLLTANKVNGVFDVFSMVSGYPTKPQAVDKTAPTVQIMSPNGGEMVTNGSMLSIAFSSKDDVGVVSQDINLSTDGGLTFPVKVASGLAGNAQSFSFPIPSSLENTMARIQVIAKDQAGNVGMDSSDSDFVIIKSTVKDTTAPTLTISNPTKGSSFKGGAMVIVNFSSKDDVGVVSHNVLLSTDGNSFNPLATGLSGNATSFAFQIPSVNSSSVAIRVEALDAASNKGTATVTELKVITDTTAPTVIVTSPGTTTKKINGNSQFTVTFTSSDNIGVVSHDIQIALDGTNFTTLASGLPGTATSAMVTIPNMKAKGSVIRVVAKDAVGNTGMADSATFKIKPKK